MSRKKVEEAPIINEDIRPSTLDELMGDRFDIYAKDVIQDRAIPDARDGMKPVQRRIIYAMYKTGNTIDKPTKKCAHIVGEVMGKYHPHGDASIYDALVRMSQSWRVRLPLVDFQGNNGSMDGDGPAAYRYTEARLSSVSQQLVLDIEKDTVDMGLTFDDTEWEPTVLPARFPNLFVNGAQGIAVGIATEIPPHNLKEIISAVIYRIQHPNCPIEALMKFVPGPDFPTGGIIYQSQGLQDIYLTGKGRIDIASKCEIVGAEGAKQIIITEIPYGVTKSLLVKEIDELRFNKTLPGIAEVRDETDKNGLRIAIDIRKEGNEEAILAYLYSKTQLRTSYSANMVAIVDGRPMTLNLLSYCDTYIAHQKDVITRRSKFDLAKVTSRLSIVEGLIKVTSIIDEVIAIIKKSSDKADSKENLQKAFGFTPEQSEAIVTMQLYKLSHTDVAVLEKEHEALLEEKALLKSILSSEEKLCDVIIEDLRRISKTYGDNRRTEIAEATTAKTIDKRDLIAKEDVYVVVTRDGYVKRSSIASFKGSGGQNGSKPGMKAGDTLIYAGQCVTTDYMLMFTTKGNYLYVPVHLLKANKWNEEGMHVNYAVSLDPDEKIVKAFAVRHFRDDLNIVILSQKGQIKRTKLSAFPVVRFNRPIRAMKLLTGDVVVDVALSSGNSDLLVFSENGLASFYNENKIALSSTTSSGVKAGSFHGANTAALLAYDPDVTNGKVVLVTDLAHARILSISNVNKGERMSRSTVVFRCFKSEEHKLLYAMKADGKEVPFTISFTSSDGTVVPVEIPDLYLTPMEKYAKKGNNLSKKNVLLYAHKEDSLLIDDSIVAFAPPIVEESEVSEAVDTDPKEENVVEENVTIVKNDDDRPAEKFEQISIFGDDDF